MGWGDLFPCTQGKAQPQMADKARIPFKEGVCMQRPFYTAILPVWHQEKVSRGQSVDTQQVPGAPALSLRPETSRPAFPYETLAVPLQLCLQSFYKAAFSVSIIPCLAFLPGIPALTFQKSQVLLALDR